MEEEYSIKPLPSFLPPALEYLKQANSEEELLSLLVQNTGDLLVFFEIMSEDETWSGRHPKMISNLLQWLTVQGFHDKLTDDSYQRIAHALRNHAAVLEPYTPKNLTIQLADAVLHANSLLLAAASPFFKDIIRKQAVEKSTSKLTFGRVEQGVFEPILEFVNTGTIQDLWKLHEAEIIKLMRQALSWGLEPVVNECSEVLKRYLSVENVYDFFAIAEQEHWQHFRGLCAHFINQRVSGFHLSMPAVDRLKIKFSDFNEETLKAFKPLQEFITDLVCRKDLSNQPDFVYVVKHVPKLLSLDIGQSATFHDNLYSTPDSLQALNLFKCEWLSQQMLYTVSTICPQLKRLQLSNNLQLNFVAWGELAKFKQLQALDVSDCQQVSDDDLSVILSACRGVLDWNLSGCSKLSDKGFFDLTKKAPRLTHLDLSHTLLSDQALIEVATRCSNLQELKLCACAKLSAKGVVACVKHAKALKLLDMSLGIISKAVIEDLRRAYPYISIIAE